MPCSPQKSGHREVAQPSCPAPCLDRQSSRSHPRATATTPTRKRSLTDRSRYGLLTGMVRTKQFDRHAVLDEAMEVFWERGFHATSIQDLVDRLGVNRQSLYDTYGGKDQLFLAALERYREIQGTPVRRLLEREGPALEVLGEFLHGF